MRDKNVNIKKNRNMAIIKCPECGHQISDRAESCPICGVKIKDNIQRCSQCGGIFLKELSACPVCHHAESSKPQYLGQQTAPKSANEIKGNTAGTNDKYKDADPSSQCNNSTNNKKRNIIIAAILAIMIIFAGLFYMSSLNSISGDEQTAYTNAMKSTDREVLEDYLSKFKDAPQEHIDSIQAHLDILIKSDSEWTNVLLSNSKTLIQQYLESHPNTVHKAEALHKIDSLDWAKCSKLNTPEAYQDYLSSHADGEHAEDAQNKLDKLDATTVNADDKIFINNLFQLFFKSINSNDEMGLTSTVSSTLHFLTNPNATKNDVITFLHKLYKDDVRTLIWRSNGDYKIAKKDMGDNTLEFDVQFTADESVNYIDSNKDKFNQYKIEAHIDSDGKISKIEFIKID